MSKNTSNLHSVCFVPYCPWPATTGTKAEMMKHLNVLNELGTCTICSARQKPVGFGWTDEAIQALSEAGFILHFREDSTKLTFAGLLGCLYAQWKTWRGQENVFGHANPYHRYAFPCKWVQTESQDADLVVMQYSFWSRFLGEKPSVVVQHELLSNFHKGGAAKETEDLTHADMILVVGEDEVDTLNARGLTNVLWSPPVFDSHQMEDNGTIGLVGTVAPQNIEGLNWLETAEIEDPPTVQVFGNLAGKCTRSFFNPVGRYGENTEPYEKCGIQLMTRADRPGLQIKVVEALACGRVIVARKGSMRGLPEGQDAWIEVDSPEEMLREAKRLSLNEEDRKTLANKARSYYETHLQKETILRKLQDAYLKVAGVQKD